MSSLHAAIGARFPADTPTSESRQSLHAFPKLIPKARFDFLLRVSGSSTLLETSMNFGIASGPRVRVATYYARLKVAQDAPPEVIRAAHRALVQKYHPDRHKGSIRHEQVVAALNRAQDILLDRESRAAHDQWIRDEEVRLGLREAPRDEDELHPIRTWFRRHHERFMPPPARRAKNAAEAREYRWHSRRRTTRAFRPPRATA